MEGTVARAPLALRANPACLVFACYCCAQVRLLCRKQFLARALGLKVAQAQRQQPQPRASGEPGPAFRLTHGDTWSHR